MDLQKLDRIKTVSYFFYFYNMDKTNSRLSADFFQRNTVTVAQELLGKVIVRVFDNGEIKSYRVTETEAYCGQEDLACHSSKGRTKRTEIMFHPGGRVYVYLIYGMYWLLNFVTEAENNASAVLIRGVEGFKGPGRLGRELQLDHSFYGVNLEDSSRLWIEESEPITSYESTPRVGIDYAGEPWVSKKWRFCVIKQ